jgi:hypothetical protein
MQRWAQRAIPGNHAHSIVRKLLSIVACDMHAVSASGPCPSLLGLFVPFWFACSQVLSALGDQQSFLHMGWSSCGNSLLLTGGLLLHAASPARVLPSEYCCAC